MTEERGLHKLQLDGRQRLTVTGVQEVVSFEETMVVLQTVEGNLVVQGQQLQLKTLSQEGQVAVEGQVSALVYEENRQRGGWRQRLFG